MTVTPIQPQINATTNKNKTKNIKWDRLNDTSHFEKKKTKQQDTHLTIKLMRNFIIN